MRRKKHKHTRRAVSFYSRSFGFHDPFKVLLDGNFIHATHSANLSNLADHIPKLLGARCKLFVTRCATREMEELGADFKESLALARKYELHKCGHSPGQCSAAACIKDQIGHSNANHWWLATQDRDLRQALSQVAGLPQIFASVNGLHLEQPAGLSKSTAHEAEASHMAVPVHERSTAALAGLDDLNREAKRAKLGTSTAKFRRNKAKGPNPLAMKKSGKKKARPAQAAEGAGGGGGGASAPKQQPREAGAPPSRSKGAEPDGSSRPRKRKRGGAKKGGAGGGGGGADGDA